MVVCELDQGLGFQKRDQAIDFRARLMHARPRTLTHPP